MARDQWPRSVMALSILARASYNVVFGCLMLFVMSALEQMRHFGVMKTRFVAVFVGMWLADTLYCIYANGDFSGVLFGISVSRLQMTRFV